MSHKTAPKPAHAPGRSFTGSRSFQSRLLHAEQWRIALMMLCVCVMIAAWITRRAMGGLVASNDAMFVQALAVMGATLLLLSAAMFDTRRRIRAGSGLPWWRLLAGAAVDLGMPFGLLLLLHLHSPRGAHDALSAPVLLVVPIVIMLSVLRLRPVFSLALGVLAAGLHAALVMDTHRIGGTGAHELPLLYSYAVLLCLSGVAAAALAFFLRRYIREAVREAEAAERAGRELAAIEHELDIARDIQQGLLPKEPPNLAGFDIAGMARPAAQAGGDYYDWQPLPNGTLVVAIADVTGHGIGPALVMAVCRAYARATAPGSSDPADFLERINGLIVQDVVGGRFITMAVVVVGPDGSAEMVSAGHGPTFLYRASSGKTEQFGGNGLPLGVNDGEKYAPITRLHLEPGDALVLLTDGFMERSDGKGSMFGCARLADVIEANARHSAERLITEIDRAVTDFANGAPQGDDMTAVVIRRV